MPCIKHYCVGRGPVARITPCNISPSSPKHRFSKILPWLLCASIIAYQPLGLYPLGKKENLTTGRYPYKGEGGLTFMSRSCGRIWLENQITRQAPSPGIPFSSHNKPQHRKWRTRTPPLPLARLICIGNFFH